MLAYWSEIWKNLESFFSAETWKEGWFFFILQFLLLAVVFYYVFKILEKNHAKKFIIIIAVVVLVAGIAFLFSDFAPGILLLAIVLVALLVFTMFSTEVKRSLLDSAYRKDDQGDATEAKKSMDEIVKAVSNMSKHRTGAMIILSDIKLPNGVIESGTQINGEISAPLLESIFFHNSPLHDGSVVIAKNRVKAAGCFVDMLAYADMVPSYMGARHRAAFSIAARAPVTVLLVSEETGRISIMDNNLPDPPKYPVYQANTKQNLPSDKMTPTSVLANGQKYIEVATEFDIREVLRKFFWDYDLGKEEEAKRSDREHG